MTIYGPPRETDRVRRHTSTKINERIDHATARRVDDFAARGRADIARRLDQLDREWSVQRVFHLGASLVGLAGAALAAAGPEDVVLTMGSLYIVGPVRECFGLYE